MPQSPANPASVRLVKKAFAVYAREIGADPSDLETVMADFIVSMMGLASSEGADFEAILEAARTQVDGGF